RVRGSKVSSVEIGNQFAGEKKKKKGRNRNDSNSVPLTRRCAPPSPFGRGNHGLIRRFVFCFDINVSEALKASASQSVSGDSTSSRCLMWTRCATFSFEDCSVLRINGALTVRPRKNQTSSTFFFGRTKK